MMASIERKLQNIRQRLMSENENMDQNGGTPQQNPTPNAPPILNHNHNRTPNVGHTNHGYQSPTTPNRSESRPVQQFPFRQYSLSATQRISNANLQLNLNQVSHRNNNRSQSLNAQCLSPRPRPRNLMIGGNNISPMGRPDSPSRSGKQLPLNLGIDSPDDKPNLVVNKFNNANDDQKLNDKFKQNNSVLSIDGKKYLAQDQDLNYIAELGTGSCGHVAKMRHLPSGKVLAVKQMRRSGNKEENKRITMDLDILLACHDCPHVVQCYGYFIKDTEVWICMELMASCFDKMLKKFKQPIPEEILGKISVATVKALNYLKDKHGVIHRDVKPSNILINENGVVKLCDFGISGRLVDSKARTRSAGCAAYMAPERIDPPDTKNPSYDIRADVWSLGITLVELATGKFPYHDCRTDFELLTKVIQDDPPSLPPEGNFSPEFNSFVESCLTKDYRKRPKYKKLLEHPFIKYYEDKTVDVGGWFRNLIQIEQWVESELSPLNIN